MQRHTQQTCWDTSPGSAKQVLCTLLGAPRIHILGQQLALSLLASINCSHIFQITLAGYENKGREEEARRGSVRVPVNQHLCLRLFQRHRLHLSGRLV